MEVLCFSQSRRAVFHFVVVTSLLALNDTMSVSPPILQRRKFHDCTVPSWFKAPSLPPFTIAEHIMSEQLWHHQGKWLSWASQLRSQLIPGGLGSFTHLEAAYIPNAS